MTRIALAVLAVVAATPLQALAQSTPPELIGQWTLVAADVQHTDGTVAHDYGATPKGWLTIDEQGRYGLQIFNPERPRFASNNRAEGTPEEYRATVLGVSSHFGSIAVGPEAGDLGFAVVGASYPNWEGITVRSRYALKGDELSWKTPARPNGDVPISVWRRAPAE
ncbi:hypothetical protein BH09PSE1_BH09PSE1_29880 [soil metagenome]